MIDGTPPRRRLRTETRVRKGTTTTMSDSTRFLIRGHIDGSYNIAVTGPLNGHAASSLRCLLHDFERDHVPLDLTECTQLTDDAFAALVAASRLADAHGGGVLLHA